MSQRGSSPSSPAPKGWRAKLDKKKLADAGMSALVGGLKGAKAVLDTTAIPGASAVFSVILACIDDAQKASRNADILQDVRAQVEAILEILERLNALPDSQQDHDISHTLKSAALDLASNLSDRAEAVKEKTTHALRPSWMTRGSDEEALQDFVRAVEADLKNFQLAQNNRIECYLEAIKQQTSAIREDVKAIKEHTREMERRGTATEKETAALLKSAQAIDDRTKAIDNTTSAAQALAIEEAADTIFRDLRRAPLASYDAERAGTVDPCSHETRVELLKEIDAWIEDSNADRVYWLKERAGFGKTAIALSVAERAAERGELAASFFFSYQVSDLNNASLFFPTLAFQLALFDQRRYRQPFAEAIKESPNAGVAKLKHQIQDLFVKPLQQAVPPTRPMVIVVDALDECQREHAQELIDLLVNASRALSLPIRLFVTSRPENHIIGAFKTVNISPRSIIDTSKDDVATYLRKELADIPRKLNMPEMTEGWITEEDIVALIRRAGGLFVYASTAIRFIGDPVELKPEERLKILLMDDEAQTSIHQPFAPLDRLYTRVLELATSSGRPNLVEEVHVVLGGCIVIEVSLSLDKMAPLLGLKVRDVRRTLVKLQSVIVCPETDQGRMSFHHASFKDFLLDSSRSGETYVIDKSIAHRRVASQSMSMITQSPYGEEVERAMVSENYVNQYMRKKIVPEELDYAVNHVFFHLSYGRKDVALKKAFDVFSKQGSLWWLEPVLPIIGQIGAIVKTYAWRVNEENVPVGILLLGRVLSLLPPCYNRTPLHKCLALTRKELRRYFRILSEHLDDQANLDSRVTSLCQTWASKQLKPDDEVPPEGVSFLDIREADWKRSCQASVQLAEEMENILDEFQLSKGNHEEVDASRRHTQRMRSNLRRVLISQHVINKNDSESEGGPETSGDEDRRGQEFMAVMQRRQKRLAALPRKSSSPQSGEDDK